MGGRSFAARGLLGTPLEEVAAGGAERSARRAAAARRRAIGNSRPQNSVMVTPEGEQHPDDAHRRDARKNPTSCGRRCRRWPSSAPLGGPRPGATVLALTKSPSGAAAAGRGAALRPRPLDGLRRRSVMALADDAAVHGPQLRVLLAAGGALAVDGIRQSRSRSDVPDAPDPATPVEVAVDVRDAAFAPVADARSRRRSPRPEARRAARIAGIVPAAGRFAATTHAERPGLYRSQPRRRAAQTTLGAADRWIYVGGNDREFADPRLNEGFLRRLARQSGGQYVPARTSGVCCRRCSAAVPQTPSPSAATSGTSRGRSCWSSFARRRVDPAPPLGAAMRFGFGLQAPGSRLQASGGVRLPAQRRIRLRARNVVLPRLLVPL